MALLNAKADPEPGSGRIGRHAGAVVWIHWTAAMAAGLWAVYAWVRSGGFPYIKDGNESALSFVHALNLYHFNPFSTGFLTTYDTEFGKAAVNSTLIYAHNPNFPRYVHYLLLLSGIRSFTTQVLLITVPLTVLNVLSAGWFFRALLDDRRFSAWLAVVPVCAIISDYIGFLAYTVNTYRTFVFCLLWLSLLGMLRPWRWWRVSLVFFALFQLEYGFAIFVFVSAMALLAMIPRPGRLCTACAALGGALVSLALFCIQLFASGAFSVPALVLEFQRTTQRRGGAHFVQYFTEALPAVGARLREINSAALNLFLVWALVSSVAVVVWRAAAPGAMPRFCAARLALSRLSVAMTLGALGASAVLTDYILEAYLGSMLPFLTFFTVTAITIAASDLFSLSILLPRKPSWLRGFVCVAAACLVVSPLIRQSVRWRRDYPGLSGGYVEILKEHFRGKPILVMGHFNQLPTALTEGPTLQMKYEEPDVVTADFSRFDRYRDEKGELVFLGLGLGWVGLDSVVARLKAKGDDVLFRGADFAVVGLRDPRFPDTSEGPDPGAVFGAVQIKLRFPRGRPGATEPILGCGRLREGVLVHVTYVDSLVARPDASHKTFTMIPGGVVKAHLAYRRDVKPPPYP